MAQYDIHEWRGAGNIRYVADIQSDFLSHLATRVVIPLRSANDVSSPLDTLHPVIRFETESYFLSAPEIVGTKRQNLGRVVGSVADRSLDVTRAVDMIMSGL